MRIDALRMVGPASSLLLLIGSYLMPFGLSAAEQHAMAVSAASLNFGNVSLASATTEAITITNTGSAPLNINGLEPLGDYAVTNNCIGVLPQSAQCTMWVTFSPTLVGSRNGAIKIVNDAPSSLHALTLRGAGVPASAISGYWANEGGDKVSQDELRATNHSENITGTVNNG